jgi:hypothetical protein
MMNKLNEYLKRAADYHDYQQWFTNNRLAVKSMTRLKIFEEFLRRKEWTAAHAKLLKKRLGNKREELCVK